MSGMEMQPTRQFPQLGVAIRLLIVLVGRRLLRMQMIGIMRVVGYHKCGPRVGVGRRGHFYVLFVFDSRNSHWAAFAALCLSGIFRFFFGGYLIFQKKI